MFNKVIKLAIAFLLLIISLTVSDSCDKDEEPNDIYVFDVSDSTDWDYWVVDKDGGNFFFELENSRPSTICFKPTIESPGYPIFLDNNGVPTKVVIEGYIFLFDNYRETLMDIAAILPNNEISVFRDIPIDYDLTSGFNKKSDQGISSNSDLIRWTGRALGVAACGVGLVAAIPSGGVSLILSAIGCTATGVGIATEFLPEDFEILGLSATTVGFVSTAVGCVSTVGVSCILGIASKEAAIASVAVEDIENKNAQINTASSQLKTGLQVTTNSLTAITANSAICGGNVTNDAVASAVTDRGVCWSTSTNPTISDNITTDGEGTGAFTSNITGLTPGTTYHVRAYAINSAGVAYGVDRTFTTSSSSNTFTDSRDGHTYKWIQIDNQVWMAENLAYLPSVNASSSGSTTSARYYVNGYQGTDVSEAKATINYQTYGVLYNAPSALNGCPTGWHLPSNEEWAALATYLGGESVAGGKLKEAGTTHWASPNTGASNESGFTALPGSSRLVDGTFGSIGTASYYWSSTLINAYPTYYGRDLIYNDLNFQPNDFNANHGLSVRCIKD